MSFWQADFQIHVYQLCEVTGGTPLSRIPVQACSHVRDALCVPAGRRDRRNDGHGSGGGDRLQSVVAASHRVPWPVGVVRRGLAALLKRVLFACSPPPTLFCPRLVFEEGVKTGLLEYAATAMLFADAMVDQNIVSCNRVVLLHGPPGTGKTSLCKALAQKLAIRFDRYSTAALLEINAHSLFSKWFSESGKLVMKLFAHIQELVDDSDALVCVLIGERDAGLRQAVQWAGRAAAANEERSAMCAPQTRLNR